MSERVSDFEAPPHSVLDKVPEGINTVTTVILDGEIQQFIFTRATSRAAAALAQPSGDPSCQK